VSELGRGTRPAGTKGQEVAKSKVMAEAGIDISRHRSMHVDELADIS
jgi:hypothetical protein